jgi:RecA-family ATPase
MTIPPYPSGTSDNVLRIAQEVAENRTAEETADDLTYRIVDWKAFWSREVEERDWLVDGFMQRGQQVVVYSTPGLGKSLLTQELAVCLALGETTLGQSKVEAINVLYIDQENSETDIRDRFDSWGITEAHDLSRLRYSLLGDWPPLNTKEGGDALAKYVMRNQIELVVIDTTSRVVEGDVFHPNTLTSLWTHTQMRLKRAGVSVIRIDHAGKDKDKGQIGTIMKSADQDVIWRLDRAEVDSVAIECEKDRSGAIPFGTRVLLRRSTSPLRHVVQTTNQAAWDLIDHEQIILDALEDAGVAITAGRPTCEASLRRAGVAVPSSAVMADIVRRRKAGGGVDA